MNFVTIHLQVIWIDVFEVLIMRRVLILFVAVLPIKEEWLCPLRLSKTSLSKEYLRCYYKQVLLNKKAKSWWKRIFLPIEHFSLIPLYGYLIFKSLAFGFFFKAKSFFISRIYCRLMKFLNSSRYRPALTLEIRITIFFVFSLLLY